MVVVERLGGSAIRVPERFPTDRFRASIVFTRVDRPRPPAEHRALRWKQGFDG